jgi:hypothetical protein
MMRSGGALIAGLAAVALLFPVSVNAEGDLAATVRQLHDCRSIDADDGRLKCFDEATNEFFESLDEPNDASSCEVEDWVYQEKADSLYIAGSTTCREGRLTIRAYDGNTGEFLGSNFTYITGYSFQTYMDTRVPDRLSMRYVIE